jgi:hexosaminidase
MIGLNLSRGRVPVSACFQGRGSTLLALALFLLPSLVAAQDPILVPQPRDLQIAGPVFRVLPTTRIVVAADSPEDRFAATSLQEELKLVTGAAFPIVSAAHGGARAIVLGRIENPTIHRLLLNHHLETPDLHSEGYVLDVQQSEVLVAGRDAAGLFYGVQTLRQLVVGKERQAEILGVRVRDWPAMPYRGTQVDLSRGPVPKLEYLKRIVRTVAEFKMNQR